MRNVSKNQAEESIFEALQGEYGTYYLPNGIKVTKAGRLCSYWGTFDKGAAVINVPSLPCRHPLNFSGNTWCCTIIVEAGAGNVPVPELAKGKRFVVFGTCLLND